MLLIDEVRAQAMGLEGWVKSPVSRLPDRQGYINALASKVHTAAVKALRSATPGSAEDHRIGSLAMLAHHLTQIDRSLRRLAGQLPCSESARAYKPVRRINRLLLIAAKGITGDSKRSGIKIGRRAQETQAGFSLELPDPLRLCLEWAFEDCQRLADTLVQLDLGQIARLDNLVRLSEAAKRLDQPDNTVAVTPLALTRSGSQIGQVSSDSSQPLAVYKEGPAVKVREEVKGIKRWRDWQPDWVPRVLSHQTHGQLASILIQHVPGDTLERLLLTQDPSLGAAIDQAMQQLTSLWSDSVIDAPANPEFMKQLRRRLKDCERLHPSFFVATQRLCGYRVPSLDARIKQIEAYEANWQAPFSVLIHGDCNLDNLLYRSSDQQVVFIDLHRSGYSDYVQDLSVMLVSMYRLPLMQGQDFTDTKLRGRVAESILDRGRAFAHRYNDHHFERRMAVGLARSLISSIRFVADPSLAKRMGLRGCYLLHSLADSSADYRLSLQELFSE